MDVNLCICLILTIKQEWQENINNMFLFYINMVHVVLRHIVKFLYMQKLRSKMSLT